MLLHNRKERLMILLSLKISTIRSVHISLLPFILPSLFLFISPEALLKNAALNKLLDKCAQTGYLKNFIIDEAHRSQFGTMHERVKDTFINALFIILFLTNFYI